MSTEFHIPPTSADRHNSPNASSTVHVAGSTLIMGLLVSVSVIALAVAFYSLAKAEAALAQADGARRESRVMSYDVTYMRANLLSRGIYIPASHEDGEDGSPDHPERAKHTLASAARDREGRDEPHGVLVRR